ncbi:hypothetical protein [Psychroflexus aestuariivivens]|uniref:hypothetical protein n=1 Tax=Psychroflexus aestuariivivens TaxID=1795040 RepID=UPI000FDB3E38|nr:hypothetical protein [Psychroflexus aestuariivivens]
MTAQKPKPFTSEKNKLIFTKIIVIYAAFFLVLKLAAIFQGAWVMTNLLIALPVVILGLIGFYLLKNNSVNWFFPIFSIILISALRYYETDLANWLHEQL